jgi:hypothetical protein
MQFNELRGDLVASVTVPPTAAGTAITVPVIELPWDITVTGVLWVPGAAVTANGTNYVTLSVRNRGAAAGTVVIAERSYASGNSVARTPEQLTLSGTASDLAPAAGDLLTVEAAHTASGLAVPAGLVQITYRLR